MDGVEIEKRIPEDEGCRIRVVLSAHLFSYSPCRVPTYVHTYPTLPYSTLSPVAHAEESSWRRVATIPAAA